MRSQDTANCGERRVSQRGILYRYLPQTDVEQFDISTADRLTVVDLTSEVQERVPPDASGTVTVFVQHTTAGVTVNEGEQRLLSDFEAALADVVPWGRQHDQIAAPSSNTAI